MANVCTGLIWELDGEGFLISKPIWLKKVVFLPNNTGDQFRLTYWGPESANPSVRTTMLRKTVTVTNTYTVTSTGNFEAAEAVVGDIMEITYTSTIYNEGFWQVGTRSNDNAIIVDINLAGFGRAGGALNNDTGATYDWKMWAPTTALKVTDDGTQSKAPVQFDFYGRGQRFPNLALNTLSGGSIVLLYLA